jgi:enoyl-CoA hydratase
MINSSISDAGIAEVVVDSPPVNALPVAGWYELADVLKSAGADPVVRAVVYGFCLGGGIGLVGNADIIVASDDASSAWPLRSQLRTGQ